MFLLLILIRPRVPAADVPNYLYVYTYYIPNFNFENYLWNRNDMFYVTYKITIVLNIT